ncbi:hypothetical protein HCJ46_07105 [Listeria booriae]|uniref:hypothetical protein n=1 Tax=Listeria booriae TaxID=1552123 RepID=UPI00162848A1|nr:hypothetical protein [Listeria booriae]MBC1918517.1 hypothetical protein [Listeria booriae]MBC2206027.1 hypothetical protein [Listeria booriae]
MSTQIDIDTAWVLKQLKKGEQAVSDFKAEATKVQHTMEKKINELNIRLGLSIQMENLKFT